VNVLGERRHEGREPIARIGTPVCDELGRLARLENAHMQAVSLIE
jgi:hypothetical protein